MPTDGNSEECGICGHKYIDYEDHISSTDHSVAALKARIAELVDLHNRAEAKFRDLLRDEHKLSDAYLRLRSKLKAWDTPYAPSKEQVWVHTEAKLDDLLAERNRAFAIAHKAEQLMADLAGVEPIYSLERLADQIDNIVTIYREQLQSALAERDAVAVWVTKHPLVRGKDLTAHRVCGSIHMMVQDTLECNELHMALLEARIAELEVAKARLAATLEWYADEVQALSRYYTADFPNTEAILAVIAVLNLDAGQRASAVLTTNDKQAAERLRALEEATDILCELEAHSSGDWILPIALRQRWAAAVSAVKKLDAYGGTSEQR